MHLSSQYNFSTAQPKLFEKILNVMLLTYKCCIFYFLAVQIYLYIINYTEDPPSLWNNCNFKDLSKPRDMFNPESKFRDCTAFKIRYHYEHCSAVSWWSLRFMINTSRRICISYCTTRIISPRLKLCKQLQNQILGRIRTTRKLL